MYRQYMSTNSLLQYVLSSSVRVDLLGLLSAAQRPTDELIDDLDASKSAVYTALADLERRDLLAEGDADWELTGQGRLVSDLIEQWESLDTLLEQDRDYWATHRTDVLPAPFRRRLPELGKYEVVRSEPPNVRAHARKVVSLLDGAEWCHTAVPIHVPEYSDAFPNTPDSRLIFPPAVIDQFHQDVTAGERDRIRRNDAVSHRVRPLDFGFTAAADFMMLALRPRSGDMVDSVVIATDDSAIQWATELHDSLWNDAEPLETYLRREHGYRL